VNETIVDLRSDTVTRPSAGMRRAMAEAEVGDDVLGDDPTVIALQEKVAALLGKEAALYVPSGTMANQVAIRCLTEPGNEIIADANSHFYYYESGAPAALSGCSIRFVQGRRGIFHADAVRANIRPENSHFPRSRLVVIENTHNRGGGSVWPIENIRGICELARSTGLVMHLDGARLMNACVASGHKPTDYTRYFDTVSMCFSKGLGAPVGSAVAGSRETIRRAHRFRKMFGGGMRQAGIIAAGAIYALEHNIDRLAEDHANARLLAEAIAEVDGLTIDLDAVETNLVFFDVDASLGTAAALCEKLRARGVWMLTEGLQRARAVIHLDVSREQILRAIDVLREVAASCRGAREPVRA